MDVRQMFLALGTPSYLADMAIPFVFLPFSSMPLQSQSMIEIVRALQRGARKLGYDHVKINGMLDAPTRRALNAVAPVWTQKAAVQIMGDVLEAMRNPEKTARDIALGLGEFRSGLGETVIDGGTALSFGQGLSNKSNIVPIPKTSGATYLAFKNLQRQINRLAFAKGVTTGEDGIIGTGTFNAWKKADEVARGAVAGFGYSSYPAKNALDLARHAVSIARSLQAAADYRGISASANKGATSTPAARSEPTPPPMTSAQQASYANDSAISGALKTYLPFLAVAGGVAWFAAKKKRKS